MKGIKNTIGRKQVELLCIDQLIPEEDLVRKVDKVIDMSFIYPLIKDLYSECEP